jgi:hypothetical protein
MGIPYSKEISKAFEELNKAYGQVTPLIEAAYEVLETTKNISLLLAGIQVLTVVLLALILLAMVGLLITMNPDLDKERRELVTPAIQWVAGWATVGMGAGWLIWVAALFVVITMGIAVMTTKHGEWVRMRVKESLTSGEGTAQDIKEQAEEEQEK